eukprot:CAMPEP_0197055934 /NCGR_PEP_ID=MMETSP1384-20130603/75840_1 /TAXON_ID=29189 /ORGANISM="Ammonia sp." /LENGTH=60 /DNA_ID=CAMNT_0042489705 /DNA_START=24 /DNA_END=202 /DNA_ORIENTATION=+
MTTGPPRDEFNDDIETGRAKETVIPPPMERQDTVWKVLSTRLPGDNYVERTKSYYEFMAG